MDLNKACCKGCGVKQGTDGIMLMLVYGNFLCCDCLEKLKQKQSQMALDLIKG